MKTKSHSKEAESHVLFTQKNSYAEPLRTRVKMWLSFWGILVCTSMALNAMGLSWWERWEELSSTIIISHQFVTRKCCCKTGKYWQIHIYYVIQQIAVRFYFFQCKWNTSLLAVRILFPMQVEIYLLNVFNNFLPTWHPSHKYIRVGCEFPKMKLFSTWNSHLWDTVHS